MFLLVVTALQQLDAPAIKPGDVANVHVTRRCAAPPPPTDGSLPTASGDDIVVCGRGQEQYRLRALPPRVAGPLLPRAETGLIGKSKIGVEAEDAGVGGFTSHRAMVKLKIPF